MFVLGLVLSAPSAVQAFGTLSLSQTYLNLSVGQSATVNAYPSGGQVVNQTANTNTYAALANVSNNVITVYGIGNGSTQMTFCTYDNTCGTLYVNVGGSSNSGQVTLGQSSLSLNTNQTASVSVYNSTGGSVYISNNSNSNIASAYVSGSTLSVTGLSNGNTTLTVCASGQTSSCATLYVTVTGSVFTNITFSQNPVNLNYQQSTTVTVYGNNSTGFYISSNSNSSVVSASVSGNSLYLYALIQGSSSITVCQTNNSCGTLTVNVGPGGSGNIVFNTTTLPQYTVNQYYFSQINVSGGNSPYNFTLSSGSLPPGISLGSTGQIFGTAGASGTYTFSVRVTDSLNRVFYSPTLTLSSGSVLGSQAYNNGTLVNDNGTIYLTYKNLKSAFANMAAFKGLGYNLNNVIVGSTSSLFSSGFVIGSTNIAHPWGSWVKYGTTIYFVHETGLIPIPSYDIFLNNGGASAGVVNANSYDLGKPVLSVMSYGDARLK